MEMKRDIRRLCELLNTAPAYFMDLQLFLLGIQSVDPSLVEQLMVQRGEFIEEQSIRENVERVYGNEAVELIERNI